MNNDQLTIDNDQLPEGYKQTEVGVIPRDWEVRKIGSLGDVVRGASPRPAGNPRFFNGTYIPWLTVAALTNIPQYQLQVYETYGGLTEEGSKHSRILEEGTLIIANSGATLGVAKLLCIKCCANDGIAAIINQKYGNKPFICYYINTKTKDLREVVATGNGQPNLNTTLIKEISIPLPPTEAEQRSIAQALSDVDRLIAALEKAIDKKRAIKTATMQQILTGKKRLPGFGEGKGYQQTEVGVIPEDWNIRVLSEMCTKIQDGTHFSPKLGGNEFYYITSKNIGRGFLNLSNAEKIDKAQHEAIYKRCDVRKGDLLLTKDGVNTGNVALNELDEEFSLLSSVALLRFEPTDYEPAYFLHLILSSESQKRIKDLMSGNAITRLTLEKIRKIPFPFPLLEEQRAIATVLSDMDTEIAALETRLAKTQSIKQGMMQQLLTGKTRLIDN